MTDRTWRGQLLELRLPAEAADYLLVATLARLASGEATTPHAGGRLSQRYWGKALTSLVTRRSIT